MESVQLTIPSTIEHLSQILTGFLMLKEQGLQVRFEMAQPDHPFWGQPVILGQYRGKQVVYDLWDGYQEPEQIRRGLEGCDFYFKRSFSQEKNQQLFPRLAEKMYPLGFNYHLSYPGDPVQEPGWKALVKPLLGRTPDKYFVPRVFEGTVEQIPGRPAKILFLTRLWDDHDPHLSAQDNQERTRINEGRIHIVRTLRSRYGENFLGGLNDTPLSRALAPELIVPAEYTERKKYLKLLHQSDICIGTMGLFESIGWKTGEYVAAAKAIVHDPLHYSVPGSFVPETNYLVFTDAQSCIAQVARLAESEQERWAMQQANAAYYQQYLRPDKLVGNTLAQMDRLLD